MSQFFKIPFEDMPDDIIITGRALNVGRDAKWEESIDIVLDFRKMKVGEVKKKLEGKAFTSIEVQFVS